MKPLDHLTHMNSGLQIGPGIDASAARRPSRATLTGRLTTLIPLDPAAHTEALYEGTHGSDRLSFNFRKMNALSDHSLFKAPFHNVHGFDEFRAGGIARPRDDLLIQQ
jgi:hypothetical protein